MAPLRLFLALAVVIAMAASCGYRSVDQGPVTLDEQHRKLCIVEVDNPTKYTWLGPDIRSILRFEMIARGWTEWTSRSQADAFVRIKIKSFTKSSSISGVDQTTLQYSANLTLKVTVEDSKTGDILWSSGDVSDGRSFYGDEAKQAEREVTEQTVRRAVHLMTQDF